MCEGLRAQILVIVPSLRLNYKNFQASNMIKQKRSQPSLKVRYRQESPKSQLHYLALPFTNVINSRITPLTRKGIKFGPYNNYNSTRIHEELEDGTRDSHANKLHTAHQVPLPSFE